MLREFARQTIRLYHRVNPSPFFTLIGVTTTDSFGLYKFTREEGVVREEVGPGGGHVLVHGELWSAHAPAPIPEGARVRVVGVRGLTVEVMPIEHQLKEAT